MTNLNAAASASPPVPGATSNSTDADEAARQVGALSSRLYNSDLAPTKLAGRKWTSYSIFTLWANDVHSLGNYAFAVGLFALGLGGWQILTALGVGAVLLFGLLTLSGYMGFKTGVPFPVLCRISLGIRGAQLGSLLRGAVAVAWFGIQTYLASVVFRIMLIALAPSLESLDRNLFLGLSTLGWITFLVLWAVQLTIVSFGMEMIRRYEAFAGPVILFTMAALAVWMFLKAGGSIALSTNQGLQGGEMWLTILGGGALWVAIYGTFVLNFCDFTRSSTSRRSITMGNFWGLPVNMMGFGLIVVVLAGAQFKINGTVIESPAEIVSTIPNTALLVLACLALLILTVAVNLMANFVAPVYALTNLFPTKLKFRSAALVSAVLGLIILPWNLYNSPAVIVYFLGGLGALLGPLFGLIMADYWLLRKARINVPALYTEDPAGDYFYASGLNPRAVAALAPAAGISLLVAFVPALEPAASFTWFIGAALAAIIYWLIADRRASYTDISGEAISVASQH